ncbi:MAG: hypothetical protein HKM01_04310 [Gallionella sp.]|nr:hypothetical protein [Gallionella sp.]
MKAKMVVRLGCAVLWFCGVLASSWASASNGGGGWVARSVSLRDLGFAQSATLNQKIREQHFYFPIAQNATIKEAYLELDATYFQQFASADGLTVLINGVPVHTQTLGQRALPSFLKMTGGDGRPLDIGTPAGEEIHLYFPLKNLDPTARFVDVALLLNSQVDAERCTEVIGRGNELRLNPPSRLHYLYAPDSVRDVRSFLTVLPRSPLVLLPSQIDEGGYKTALRLLMGLRSRGLEPRLLRLPAIGDVVRVDDLRLPKDFAGMPFFQPLVAAAQRKQTWRIANENDAAVWLAARLLSEQGLADVVVDASSLRGAFVQAERVWLGQGLLPRLPAAVARALEWAKTPASPQVNIRLMNWPGMQMLLLDAPGKNPSALLAASFWSEIANGDALGVAQISPLKVDAHTHRLMIAQNLPVQYLQGMVRWDVPFTAKHLPNGERPNALQLNIVSAHRTGDTPAVVSVFMNDFLLTAKDLRGDGEVTAVSAFVPLYTLKANNVVRIEVTDTAHKNCANVQSLPVQVLPSSYLGLGGASDVNEFFSLLPLLDDDTRVIIPAGYLRHAEDSLMTVSRVLQGLAMFADGFKLEVSADREKAMRGPFVSFEVLPAKANSLVDAQLDKLVVRDKKRNTVFDSKGLGGLAVVQVIDGQGVLVSRVGSDALNLQVPLEFSNGNLVVLDSQGVKLTLNTNDPQDEFDLNESGRGLFFLIERYHVPFVIAVIVLLIALTLLVIRSVLKERHRRLARRRDDQHGKP